MIPCLSQVCTLNSPLEDDVSEYAAGMSEYAAGNGVAIEFWLTKLENYLQRHSVQAAKQLLSDHGLQAPVASGQGGLLTSQTDSREAAWSLFAERLKLCQQLSIRTLVIACDVTAPISQADVDRIKVLLQRAADLSREHDLRIALEFQAQSAFGNNLQTTVALVEELGQPNLGICLDLFHFWVGPSKLVDLELIHRENLFHVQLSDMAAVPREFAADAHRILPGDGDLPLSAVIGRLREIGYEGCLSVELMNPQIWQIAPRQFSEVAMKSLERLGAVPKPAKDDLT